MGQHSRFLLLLGSAWLAYAAVLAAPGFTRVEQKAVTALVEQVAEVRLIRE